MTLLASFGKVPKRWFRFQLPLGSRPDSSSSKATSWPPTTTTPSINARPQAFNTTYPKNARTNRLRGKRSCSYLAI
jgi:hypothetical protein